MRLPHLQLLAVLLAFAALIATPPLAEANRGCGTAFLERGARVHVRVVNGSVPCVTARRVVRSYFDADSRCAGSSCVRRIEGWTCQLAAPFRSPRLGSCLRGSRRVAAYAD
jgi:hypothetical protein